MVEVNTFSKVLEAVETQVLLPAELAASKLHHKAGAYVVSLEEMN
jgi:hypothetical protein